MARLKHTLPITGRVQHAATGFSTQCFRQRPHLKTTVMAGLSLLTLTTSAVAQNRIAYLDGNELHEMCQADPAACTGYIMGVADALEATAWPSPRSCRPKSVVAEQIIDLAIKTLKDNPAERHRPAFDLIADEVVRLWPC